MRTSCIQHPAKENLIIVRKWQIEFCDGNKAAAALLSFFEYWHNIKLEQSQKAERANSIAEMHGDERTQDESLLQFHTEKELEDGILLYGKTVINAALKLLVNKGAITISKNPNPRYAFDKTRYFLLHPGVLNAWISDRSDPGDRRGESGSQSTGSGSQSTGSGGAITETTTETTTENKENPPTPHEPTIANKPSGFFSETEKPETETQEIPEEAQAEYQKIYPGTPYRNGNRFHSYADSEEIQRRNQFSKPDERRALAIKLARSCRWVDAEILERDHYQQLFKFEGIISYMFEHNIPERVFRAAVNSIIKAEAEAQEKTGKRGVIYAGAVMNQLPFAIQSAMGAQK